MNDSLDDELNFDRAEFAGMEARNSTSCTGCGGGISDAYYEANGEVICEPCAASASDPGGDSSSTARVMRAAVFGSVAAALGWALYYGIFALTGYEFGLIAIVVGFMVGAAVSAGSGGRGGWLYQLMAMGLTYTAMVMTYVPMILEDAAADGGISVVVAVAISFVAPFLMGMENIIGLIILGIGIYEAWKLNKRVAITVTGPHPLEVVAQPVVAA